jgi:hypothetical protein
MEGQWWWWVVFDNLGDEPPLKRRLNGLGEIFLLKIYGGSGRAFGCAQG